MIKETEITIDWLGEGTGLPPMDIKLPHQARVKYFKFRFKNDDRNRLIFLWLAKPDLVLYFMQKSSYFIETFITYWSFDPKIYELYDNYQVDCSYIDMENAPRIKLEDKMCFADITYDLSKKIK